MAITMNASQASIPSALFHNEEAYDDDDDDVDITYGELQDDDDDDEQPRRGISRRPSKEISLDLDDLLEEIENENIAHASNNNNINSNSGSLGFHISSRLNLEDLPDCPCGYCLDDDKEDECLPQKEKKVRFGGASKPPTKLQPCKLPSKRHILDERSSYLSKKVDNKKFAKDVLMGLEIVTTTTSPNESSSSSTMPIHHHQHHQQQQQVGQQN